MFSECGPTMTEVTCRLPLCAARLDAILEPDVIPRLDAIPELVDGPQVLSLM